MNLLLDTHVLLWWLADAEELSTELRRRIADPRTGVWVSPVSAWEISIKSSLGKLTAPDDFDEVLAKCHFEELPITWRHASLAGQLPEHHRDPFDRMLIAQATSEGLTIATVDSVFAAYEVPVI